MLNLFRKKRRFSVVRKPKKRRTVATEFTKQRKKSVKYKVSRARFTVGRVVKIVAAFSFLITLVVGTVVLLFFSTFFSIQHIELVRRDFRADMEQISPITEPFRGGNIFFVSKSEIENELYDNFPQIEDIEIERVFPRTIRISISTFPIVAKWQVNIKKGPSTIEEVGDESKFVAQEIYINAVGQMSEGTDQDSSVFPIEEHGLRDDPFVIGDSVILSDHLDAINKCKELLGVALETNIVGAKYFRDAKEAHFISERGTAFWIDLAFDLEKQINKMKHVIAETEILSEDVEYFDLRIEKRIFWKPQE